MNRVRPFANRLLKQKELELTDIYHDQNLKEIKPLTVRLMEHSETITINNSKREMIKEVREQEIERENKLLLEKIRNYSITKTKTITTRPSKSLNELARKKQLESIQMENKQMFTRLNSKRATLNTLKFKKDWEDSRSLIKRMENCQFNMVYFKYREGVKSKKNQKITEEKLEKINISQFRVINGQKMLIKVTFAQGFLNIVGDINQRDLKFIKIPKQEAIDLISSSCQGKLQKLLEKLAYDKCTSTLYIANQELGQDFFNPESVQTNLKKEVYKLKQLTHRVNKSEFEHTPTTNKSEKDSIRHHESISHKATMPSAVQVKLQKQSQADEQQQNYQRQQFEEPIQEGKLTDKQIASIIGNQKDEPVMKKQADPAGAQILIEAEEQNYNDDFQKSQELNQKNNLETI